MIEVENLSKIYGATQAIKDISFSVEKGTILGFLGANGAGKTTTMRILSGYIPATTGKVTIAGFEVHENPMAVRERIGYLPENPPLYTDMTVREYLSFVTKIKGVSRTQRGEKIKKALQCCQIEDRADTIIRKLSKGYRQRVGIAQAIVHDPPVIILDEPTVGLDPRQIIEVRNLIKSLAGERTVILSTHILPEVSMTCDLVTIINKGMVVTTGTPDELLQQMQGNAGYEIEVEGDISNLVIKLKQILGVKTVKITEISERKNRFLINISLDKNYDMGKDIASTIVYEGIGIYEMKRSHPSLEDVFLQLTTNENLTE
ncbi:MAG: ABC transporter ATP-binding protein [Cyanobacteria bacterium]|nr:ABC transporter ATP-binding protein [Cyanobacteria bacterium CG_2015-16_32_12]NCO78690.1 ABC transporter ATP-binding protein [Cyanobacteria bacterium CG_2015-22_32_23]NCQ03173.1 ABC transporter ATP-binding protein [Cyanobacteria bacterium CG_2015-09_32_10]NCQ41445.1 ABC transporter ATP-binding protein [Cyanobacteria bacterium CG_2015-04_32_10]NCS85749.1 ABC transporter ATP-binding protein [Cyanobacteria bacterium CG_2015-02_32_10]